MKIKLVEPGWEGYSDYLGPVLFKDGVSVDDVSQAEASRLASIVGIETLEGKNPSPAQMILDSWSGPMTVATLATADKLPVAPGKSWTEAELAALGDEKGIKGLRAVGDPLGVKGTSIPDLIAKIVAATKQPEVTPVAAEGADGAEAAAAAAAAATVAADPAVAAADAANAAA